jgi:hypothetical protein
MLVPVHEADCTSVQLRVVVQHEPSTEHGVPEQVV